MLVNLWRAATVGGLVVTGASIAGAQNEPSGAGSANSGLGGNATQSPSTILDGAAATEPGLGSGSGDRGSADWDVGQTGYDRFQYHMGRRYQMDGQGGNANQAGSEAPGNQPTAPATDAAVGAPPAGQVQKTKNSGLTSALGADAEREWQNWQDAQVGWRQSDQHWRQTDRYWRDPARRTNPNFNAYWQSSDAYWQDSGRYAETLDGAAGNRATGGATAGEPATGGAAGGARSSVTGTDRTKSVAGTDRNTGAAGGAAGDAPKAGRSGTAGQSGDSAGGSTRDSGGGAGVEGGAGAGRSGSGSTGSSGASGSAGGAGAGSGGGGAS